MLLARRRPVLCCRLATRRLSTALGHAPPTFDLAAIRAELEAEHTQQGCSAESLSYDNRSAPWHWLDREMSSNVAGETGAVCIYDGAASALRLRGSIASNIDPSTL
eukprot:5646773-Prymnesium_polylepis.1